MKKSSVETWSPTLSKNVRRLCDVGCGCRLSQEFVEAAPRFVHNCEVMERRVVGVEPWRKAGATVYRKVGLQRIAGTSARIGTTAVALVERAKQEF